MCAQISVLLSRTKVLNTEQGHGVRVVQESLPGAGGGDKARARQRELRPRVGRRRPVRRDDGARALVRRDWSTPRQHVQASTPLAGRTTRLREITSRPPSIQRRRPALRVGRTCLRARRGAADKPRHHVRRRGCRRVRVGRQSLRKSHRGKIASLALRRAARQVGAVFAAARASRADEKMKASAVEARRIIENRFARGARPSPNAA